MEKLTLELTKEEVERILNVLSQVPYKDSHELIHKIQIQGKAQLEPKGEDAVGQ